MNLFDQSLAPGSRGNNTVAGATTDPPAARRVLIVDDEASVRKLLAVMLEESAIPYRSASNGEEALKFLRGESFDAVISDLQMPGISGLDLLVQVRQQYPHVAFLMATGVDDVQVGIQAMRQGADDYLVKPLQMDAVTISLQRAIQRKRLELEVENYRLHLEEMVAERTQQLQTAFRHVERSYGETLQALGEAIDLRDSETAGHSRRVSLYSLKILTGLGGTEHQFRSVAMGAWLHDIGKLAIPDAILLKPGPLTSEERRVMQRHSQIGYDLVKRISFLSEAAEIVLMHHERCDGSGYPLGLKGQDIPLGARIFGVSDTVDAMTSDRPYRSARPFQEARDQIERGSGKLYDTQVASVFLSISSETWEVIRAETAVQAESVSEGREG
jgi:response regulator RpfG family c-di-GMP phosphodiesterase